MAAVRALLAVLLVGAFGATGAAALEVESVKACLARNAPSVSARYQLEFDSTDARGRVGSQRAEVWWRRFERGERRVLLRLEAPESVAGSALLAVVKPHENPRIHLYLPELGRSQRIYRPEQLRTFFGRSGVELSELWRTLESTPQLADRVLDPEARVANRPAWQVEGLFEIPRQDAVERVVSYVDTETCVPLRIERLDEQGAVRRRLDVDPARLEPLGERWIPRELVFTDLHDGSTARVSVRSVELDVPLAPGLLTVKALARP